MRRPKRPNLEAVERRVKLIRWMRERPEHSGLTARQIADVSGIYSGYGRADRCFDDLKALEGQVRREGRPAIWTVVPYRESEDAALEAVAQKLLFIGPGDWDEYPEHQRKYVKSVAAGLLRVADEARLRAASPATEGLTEELVKVFTQIKRLLPGGINQSDIEWLCDQALSRLSGEPSR